MKVTNIINDIEDLSKNVAKYEKLPDNEKVGKLYDELKNKITAYSELLKVHELLLNETDLEVSEEDVNDDVRYSTYIERINIIKELDITSDKTPLEEKLKFYDELNRMIQWCRRYVDAQKLDIRFI